MVFQRGGCIYVLTNTRHTVFYIGVTSDILSRIYDHKNKTHPNSFTAKYNCDKLVYYEFHPHIEEAIATEKALKGGNRQAKTDLVYSLNPEWKDLYYELLNE